jgi:hypothetical protein
MHTREHLGGSGAAMKIRELERVSGVHRSTIHHYVNLGLPQGQRAEASPV